MPHVRVLAAPQRMPDGSMYLHHAASVLEHLASSDVLATGAARALVTSLLERLGEVADGFGPRLRLLHDAPAGGGPPPIEALGYRRARALEVACTGPTVEVSEAELLVLGELRAAATMPARWTANPKGALGPGEWRVLGPIVEALARDEGEPSEAPALAPYLPSPETPPAEGKAPPA